jgi:Tol biopolymer transport system component
VRALATILLFAAAVAAQDGALRILFLAKEKEEDPGYALRSMAPDGTDARDLAPRSLGAFDFTARAGRIALVCDPDDTEEFRLLELDPATGKTRRVCRGIGFFPRFSPDGKRLAYMNHAGRWRICITKEGSYEFVVLAPPEKKRLPSGISTNDGAPEWSPDGRWITFYSNRAGNMELHVAEPGGKPLRLTRTADEGEMMPAFSPDGNLIAFRSKGDVHVIRSDGSGRRNLSHSPAEDVLGGWSPDGNELAVVSGPEGERDILVVDVRSGKARRLTRDAASDWAPAWSPDGKSIVFLSNRDGADEVYVVNADGKGLRRLTKSGGRKSHPTWLVLR